MPSHPDTTSTLRHCRRPTHASGHRLRFTKMQGLGNDFVVFDAVRQSVTLNAEQIRWIADRHFGIGCDQLLLVEPAREPQQDFYYRIFNADGAEVEQCGNGARCFARFVTEQGLTDRQTIAVGTLSGPLQLQVEAAGIRVNMGQPVFEPSLIPFIADSGPAPVYSLEAAGQVLEVSALSMGNPHLVLRVDEVASAPVAELGPVLEPHPRFPRRVNVGFMQVLDTEHIQLRVYERGVGETLACGTGACAAVVAGRLRGWLNPRVQVTLPGGVLQVQWLGSSEPVWMTGPAETVFEGQITL